ncbi:MAG: hypothetical protein E6K53_01565 [Gammaproteobacteria bacterium]|nr:MAG: hypothetical protein E6K53_01565 [Gammaproteobacteria bacterium]
MRRLTIILCMLAMTHIGGAHATSSVKTDELGVELVSQSSTLAPGATAWLGLHLKHAPHWHTYWINPGDSGLPMKLNWSLPPGFIADDIAWPAPKRFSVGELANFGYDGEVLLPVMLHVSPNAKPGTFVNIVVDARWLVCHEECIPGRATLTLDLPVATQAQVDQRWRVAFAAARGAQPQGEPLKASARVSGSSIEISLPHGELRDAARLDAFAVQGKVIANTPPAVTLRNSNIMLIFVKSDYFTSIPDALDLVIVRTRAPALRAHAVFAESGAISKPPH